MAVHVVMQVETWKHRTRNQLMFSPNLAASNDTCRIEEQSAPAAPLLLEGTDSKSRTKRLLIQQSRAQVAQITAADSDYAGGNPSELSRVVGAKPQAAVAGPVSGSESSSAARNDPSKSEQDQVGEVDSPPPGRTEFSTETSLHSPHSDDHLGSQPPQRQDKASLGATPAVPRAPVVVKTNPKVIQAHATRFPVPRPRPPKDPQWPSPIESPSSSRESVAELLAGRTDAPDYAEVPMTPSRVPVSSTTFFCFHGPFIGCDFCLVRVVRRFNMGVVCQLRCYVVFGKSQYANAGGLSPSPNLPRSWVVSGGRPPAAWLL